MIYKMGRFGRFEACSNYPKCKYIKPQKLEETGETCPNCGSPVVWKRVVLVHLKPALIIQDVTILIERKEEE